MTKTYNVDDYRKFATFIPDFDDPDEEVLFSECEGDFDDALHTAKCDLLMHPGIESLKLKADVPGEGWVTIFSMKKGD